MNSSNFGNDFLIPEFRGNHCALKEKIRNLKRNSEVLRRHGLYQICVDVEDKILEFNEEPTLSVLQNKIRKLDAGSELCKEICLLQKHFVNLEINTAVSEVLDEKKYENICKKITSRKLQDHKREIFFYKQAVNITKEFSTKDTDEESAMKERPLQEKVSTFVDGLPGTNLEARSENSSIQLDECGPETARIVDPENVDIEDENLRVSSVTGRVMDVISSLGDATIPDMEARNIDQKSELDIDLNELERILENGINELEGIQDTAINERAKISEALNGDVSGSVDLESLPPVSDTRSGRKKRFHPVFDRGTTIENYSKRARKLNESVTVNRVQVYEGPPSVIHAFTIKHMLETPAVNNGYSGAIRSSVLQSLYSRHQITQQKQLRELHHDFHSRDSVVPEMPNAVEEVIRPRQESRSCAPKSQLLDISVVETGDSRMKATEVAPNSIEAQLEQLLGPPVSKEAQMEIAPPASNSLLPPRARSRRNRNGKSLEGPTPDPWFKPIEQSAPSEKWREFKYVRNCLELIWKEKEEKNLEKGASLREVLEREDDWRKENMLTLLRIVDKMSLRREVVIKGHGIGVIVHPFEMPFVTEKQYSLRGQEPRF